MRKLDHVLVEALHLDQEQDSVRMTNYAEVKFHGLFFMSEFCTRSIGYKVYL